VRFRWRFYNGIVLITKDSRWAAANSKMTRSRGADLLEGGFVGDGDEIILDRVLSLERVIVGASVIAVAGAFVNSV
jgi:hypothetical protein